jgi:hypothetical protein
MAVSLTKFQTFAGDLGLKVHNLNSDTLKVYLSNATPDVAAHAVKADLAEISAGNNYTAGGKDISNTYSQSGGTGSCVGTDQVWTASGGTIGPFRYAVLYNDDSVNDSLIGYWDYGSAITLQDAETFTLDVGATILTIT